MSLQVWLPLKENLTNQGVTDITVTNKGATIDANGKIGKCYSTNAGYITTDKNVINNLTGDFSVACWVYINSWNANFQTVWCASMGSTPWNKLSAVFLRNSASNSLCFSISDGSAYIGNNCSTGALSTGVWYHFVCCYTSGKIQIYQNGTLVKNLSTSIIPKMSGVTEFQIGRCCGAYPNDMKINDFRIYNHCLSIKEIKEISRGLLCHYPLSQPEHSVNLIANSKSVTSGGNAPGITSELMSDGSLKITAASGNSNYRSCGFTDSTTTSNNVAKYLAKGTPYTVSFDIKVESGTKFPSLFLNTNYYPMIGGDPTLHGIWQRVYQTRNYDGQSTNYGYISIHLGFSGAIGTYYVKNFKLEAGTNTNPKWSPAISDSDNWGLGEYDVSGYGNNGFISQATMPICAGESPRYNNCYSFNGSNQYIDVGQGGKVKDEISVAWWGYMDSWSGYGRAISCTEGGGWDFEPNSGYMSFPVGCGTSSNTYQHVSSKTKLADLSAGWHHWVGTYDGFKLCLYKDGVLDNSVTAYTTKTPIYYPANQIFIGCEAAGSSPSSPYFKGKISDVRIYATALSADDVKELYNTPFTVTNNGKLFVQGEVIEV